MVGEGVSGLLKDIGLKDIGLKDIGLKNIGGIGILNFSDCDRP